MGNHGEIAPTDAHLKTQTQNSKLITPLRLPLEQIKLLHIHRIAVPIDRE